MTMPLKQLKSNYVRNFRKNQLKTKIAIQTAMATDGFKLEMYVFEHKNNVQTIQNLYN